MIESEGVGTGKILRRVKSPTLPRKELLEKVCQLMTGMRLAPDLPLTSPGASPFLYRSPIGQAVSGWLFEHPERWQSGRMRALGKRV
jgi:hypothetical protein